VCLCVCLCMYVGGCVCMQSQWIGKSEGVIVNFPLKSKCVCV